MKTYIADKFIKNDGLATESLMADGSSKVISSLTPLTYSALKTLRDSSQLIAGMQYRITDFVTTVGSSITYAQSAGHAFDVIVVADSANKLNENARAIRHEGDTYFPSYTKFEAWELKYALDNDVLRFDWADSTSGKGVIYFMRDENKNECSYDFKNVQFKRWAITDYPDDTPEGLSKQYLINVNYNDFKFKYKQRYAWTSTPQSPFADATIDAMDFDWYFTFNNVYGTEGTYGTNQDQSTFIYGVDTEASTVGSESTYTYGNIVLAHGNLIKPLRNKVTVDDVEFQIIALNNIVLCNSRICNEESGVAINSNVYGFDCYSNTFIGGKISSNTFGNNVVYNTFGSDVNSNTFGNNVGYNTFGNSVKYNTFGNNVNYNTFGNGVSSNTFGNNVSSNTFGNNVGYNTFVNNVSSNTFGNNVSSNTFGDSVNYNTFVNNVSSNTFGNGVSSNTFGNNVSSNTFGNHVYFVDFGDNKGGDVSTFYGTYLIVKDGVKGTGISRINIDTGIALLSTTPRQVTVMQSATDGTYIFESRVSATTTEAIEVTI